ncbi:MAG: hypothetical protein O2909_12790 [Chloroflexi bacterium]|nr:hypothetical protein [Chloroflexota bacterium]MDA1220286.1 hypothetical protein [Chloroflexota bacterium]
MQRNMFTVSPMFRVTFATAGLALVAVLALVGVLNLVSLTAADPVEASSANISQNLPTNTDLGKLTEPFASPIPAATTLVTGTTTFVASPNKPGSASSYTATFVTTSDLTVGTDTIILHFDKDFQFPATLDRTGITLSSTSVTNGSGGASDSVNPQTVIVDLIGTENNEPQVTMTVPDMRLGDATTSTGAQSIAAGSTVTVVLQQSAGVKNPTEGGGFDFFVSTSQETTEVAPGTAFSVPFIIEMSSADGPRGENLTLVGLGFKNATTVTFWRDANGDGVRDALEIDLCNAVASGADIATCTYSVSNPPFAPRLGFDCTFPNLSGCNFINAVDGRNNKVTISSQADIDRSTFDLRGSVTASPSEANPGDTITIQLKDFPPSETVTTITLGGFAMTTTPATVTIDVQGEANFTINIPNDVALGVQVLEVRTATSTTRRTKIIIGSATLLATPSTVVPNQRISVVGTGFTEGGGATINQAGDGSAVTIGGEVIHASKINDGAAITVDNGGSWSASIDLPITTATATAGTRELRVVDSNGREGKVNLIFPARTLTLDPVEGAVGSNVTVT